MTSNESLAKAVRQRSQLGDAMQRVEEAAAAPAAKESWAEDLSERLLQLETAFDQHIIEAQSPTGILNQVVDQAPRLQNATEHLKREDDRIAQTIDDVIETAEAGSADVVIGLRESVMEVLVDLARHRQQGADLLYEAYAVDIGGY
jgi:ATP-dependent Clp protease ATP-binding subunit ClpA